MPVTEHVWHPLVITHAVAATLALVLGAVNLARRPKGDSPHRVIGRSWVGLTYFTAFSSFGIQMIRPGSFSWIHALSVLTIVTLTLGLRDARRGNARGHAGNMIGTYLGMWGAFIGVVAVPSRMVPQAFQQSWRAMAALTAAVVLAGLGFVALVIRVLPRQPSPARATA